jgi:hypothetical protein
VLKKALQKLEYEEIIERKKRSSFLPLSSKRKDEGTKTLKQTHNLVSFKNIDVVFSIFSLVIFVLYILQ